MTALENPVLTCMGIHLRKVITVCTSTAEDEELHCELSAH